jgi:hypothetical protein
MPKIVFCRECQSALVSELARSDRAVTQIQMLCAECDASLSREAGPLVRAWGFASWLTADRLTELGVNVSQVRKRIMRLYLESF